MTDQSDPVDEREVDVALMRELLKLIPAQRVERMINIVKTMQDIRVHAKAVPNLVIDFGMIDVSSTPMGPKPDYDSWEIEASDEEIADDLRIRDAYLDDILASKEAAGRDKDVRALPYLRSLKDLPKDVG